MKNTQDTLTKEERLQCLKDMQEIRFTQCRADLIANMESGILRAKESPRWNEAHDRCQSCIDKAVGIVASIKSPINKREASACIEVMKELLQESPEDMEERVKALMAIVWANA